MKGRARSQKLMLLALLGAFLTLDPHQVSGSVAPGASRAPRAVAPEAGATVSAGALRFGWAPPAGTQRHALLVSETDFDARGWNALPSGSGLSVFELKHPVVSFTDLGIALDRERPLYWAVASSSGSDARWTFGLTRMVRVVPRFANRLAPTPYLEASPIGRAAPVVESEPRRIRLAAGYVIDPGQGQPDLPSALIESESPSAARQRAYLVHYGDQDPDRVRESIVASGATVVAHVPDRTFLVRMRAGQFSLDGQDSWMGSYQPAYKLSAELNLIDPAARAMTVLAFPDGNLADVSDAVVAAGGRVLASSDQPTSKILRVELPGAGAAALAQHVDVQWIEPYVQPILDNGQAQYILQTGVTSNRRLWTLGLEGQGQVFHHSDSGIDMTHEMFLDPAVGVPTYGSYPTHRKVITYENGSPSPDAMFGDHAGASWHGSHTGGTTAGQDTVLPYDGNDGLARRGKIWHSDLAGPTMANGLVPPVDLNDLFQPSYTGNAGGAARISTNSWGAPVSGAYTVDSYNLDRFMWNHPDYLVFFSAGNSGSAAGTIGSPASAKNCVTVGGTRNGASANQIYAFSSRGPTLDNRRKPTICAPAQSLRSAQQGPAVYGSLAGTSMACPAAAGVAGLMRQYCTEGWYPTGAKVPANGFAPSASLLKAMVVNSGTNAVTGFVPPSNDVGYGRVNADSMLYFAGDARGLLLVDFTSGLGHGQMIEYKVNVLSNTISFEVALCWVDYPGNPAAAIQLVNDLNLTVTNGVSTYRGNWFSAGFSTIGGSYDNRNVEETVIVRFPGPGLWTIRIEGNQVPVGPQPFGLCITGNLGTNAGALTLDRNQYGSSATVEMQVTDTNAGGSVNVTLSSTTEPGGETVVVPGANGIYSGTLPLSPVAGTVGDGTLQVSHGDVITATYNDASPVATLTQTATVSLNAPIITDVTSTSSGTGTVSVSWSTNTNASSRIYYGLTPALGQSSALDPSAVLSHAVVLTGLSSGTTYYFDVESQDLQGNTTRDDNGGQHYQFSVRPPGDLLLVYGGSGFEREHRYEAALDSLGWFYDTWTGTLGDHPPVGDLSSGMRSYDAVWWQPQLELYPPVHDAARDSIDLYLNGGGRFAITAHDVAWALADPNSEYYSVTRQAWVVNSLHAVFQTDPPGWTSITGVGGDPISANWVGGVSYAEHRAGASGDEVLPGAGAVGSWLRGLAECAVRWESGGPQGTAGTGVWGGENTRVTSMFFEWSNIDPITDVNSVTRRDVLRKTLAWLLGRDKPNVTVTAPNGGETITTNSTSITWSETLDGAAVAARTIEYSTDGGGSWTVLTAAAGSSPYSWDLTSVPNTASARVRVRVLDDGDPAFTGHDLSDNLFTIARAGGDLIGPGVVAGSIQSSPNPMLNTTSVALSATLSDVLAGGSNVTAAEWSAGPAPVSPGGGQAMSGSFASPEETVTASIPSNSITTGTVRIWVRGRDSEGNWGNASSVEFLVNGNPVTSAGPVLPGRLELRAVAPNPVQRTTTVSYALPSAARVRLVIYDVVGRKVKTLVEGERPAGIHSAQWDRSDDRGRTAGPGVYFTRLEVGDKVMQRKIVTIN